MLQRINKINETAKENFDKAKGMLEMFNDIYGTRFGLLGGRVVWFENPDGSVAEKYAHAHDAYMNIGWREDM